MKIILLKFLVSSALWNLYGVKGRGPHSWFETRIKLYCTSLSLYSNSSTGCSCIMLSLLRRTLLITIID